MKRIVSVASIALLSAANGCEEKGVSPKDYLSFCNAPKGRTIAGTTATVMKETIGGDTFYYLGTPPYGGGYLVCNLPKQFRKEGLKVSYSGFQREITYPEGLDPIWSLIELTQITEARE